MGNFYDKNIRRKIVRSILHVLKRTLRNSAYSDYLLELIFYDYMKNPEELYKVDLFYFKFLSEILMNVKLYNIPR